MAAAAARGEPPPRPPAAPGHEGDITTPLLHDSSSADGEAPLLLRVESDAGLPASPGSCSSFKPPRRGTAWPMTAAVLLADMLGLGTLSLPADFARLGWLPGVACLAWFALADVYSGWLYQRLTLAVPQAVVFDQIGGAALGKLGSGLVFATIYVSILCCPVILHLTCVETLRQALFMFDLSKPVAFWIVTAVVFPLGQFHQMEDVAFVSVFGTLAMVGAMAIVVGKLLVIYATQPAAAIAAPTELVARGQGLQSALVGVLDIAFAWGGQINFLRYITTMRDRSKFSSAVSLTAGFMAVIYLAVAAAGYSVFGSALDLHKPISSVLGQDGWTVAMNAGIFTRCIISYQVNINVWSALLLHLTVPKHAEELAVTRSWQRKGLWALVTALCIGFGGLVSYSVPFFSLVMALIASLGDVLSMTGLPCLFALWLLRLGPWERRLCWLLLGLSVLLSGAGVVSSLQQLLAAARGGGG